MICLLLLVWSIYCHKRSFATSFYSLDVRLGKCRYFVALFTFIIKSLTPFWNLKCIVNCDSKTFHLSMDLSSKTLLFDKLNTQNFTAQVKIHLLPSPFLSRHFQKIIMFYETEKVFKCSGNHRFYLKLNTCSLSPQAERVSKVYDL